VELEYPPITENALYQWLIKVREKFIENEPSETTQTFTVTLSEVVVGEILVYSGTIWGNRTLTEAGIALANHSHTEFEQLKRYSLLLS